MDIKFSGSKNLYVEIAEEYKRFINMGVLRAGEKLPSCRALALDLGINPNTAERAYSLLEADGYIMTIPKKGVYVKERAGCGEQAIDALKQALLTARTAGVKYETVRELTDSIYGGEENDRDKATD